jgi:Ras-related and estrogen-regulated growth inhibitor-like protein
MFWLTVGFLINYLQIPEQTGAQLAASHGVGFCEVSVAENSPNLYKIFEKLLTKCRARPRKFSVTKMIGTLIGNNGSKQTLSNSGTVVPCHKGELQKLRVLKRRQAFTATASLWPKSSLSDGSDNS